MIALLMLAAAAAVPTPMAPSGPWLVDGEENLCALERNYVAGATKMTLSFQPLLDLDDMELSVISDDKSQVQRAGKAIVALEPGGRHFEGSYFSVYVPSKKFRVTRLTIDKTILDAMKDGDRLTIDAKPISTSFIVVHPGRAVGLLRDCQASLLKSWGVDPASKAAIATLPEGQPASYFTPKDYPSEALHLGAYGRVVALLQIDTAGHVDNCRIVSSAGKSLNDGTCKVAMRIRFKPARDAGGNAVASTYLLPVRWAIP